MNIVKFNTSYIAREFNVKTGVFIVPYMCSLPMKQLKIGAIKDSDYMKLTGMTYSICMQAWCIYIINTLLYSIGENISKPAL